MNMWINTSQNIKVHLLVIYIFVDIMKFIIKNLSHSTLCIGYKEKIEQMVHTKFLDLQIDNHLSWKSHTEQMITKLGAACYVIRLMGHISNLNTLKSIYYICFHSVINYGIIFQVSLFQQYDYFHFTKENCQNCG